MYHVTKYYISITVITCVSLLILTLLVRENARLEKKEKGTYYLAYLVIAIAALAECGGLAFNGRQEVPLVLFKIVKYTDYIFTPLAGAMFIEQLRLRNIWHRVMMGLVAINTVMQVISFFTNWIVVFDENHYYHNGPLYFVYILIYILITLVTFIQFILYGRSFVRQNRSSLYVTLVLIFVGIAAQEVFAGEVRTAYLALTLGASFLFIHYTEFAQMRADKKLMDQKIKLKETEALKEAKLAAEEASRAKSDFLANMSHEIRTPINAVLGMNEMILRESEDENILAYAENIQSASNMLLGLVSDILDFSKIEAGKVDIIPERYDLAEVLRDLVNVAQVRAKDKGIDLKINFDENIPRYLEGDDIRIKQICTNILSNAIKYTREGEVCFDIGFSESENDDEVILDVSVKDTGIGIKAEDMDKLFLEFERLERSRNRNVEGAGLGLTITKKLLEMMGSDLKVDSVYGSGTTISFSLPQRVKKWEPLGQYEVYGNISQNHRHIEKENFIAPSASVLMVDDNPMNLTVFENLTKRIKLKVDTAISGFDGLALTKKNTYDIIFLDHMMPKKDGIETLHELREDDSNANRDVPVICFTANSIAGAREWYISEGFDDYMTKPIESKRLESMLKFYLPDEKIVKVEDEENDASSLASEEIEGNDFLEILKKSGQINITKGIENSGSVESYLQLIKIFYDSMDHTIDIISNFYDNDDIENYTIKVHALKSSARLIGAIDLGEEAQRLENAGKSADTDFIHTNHQKFMDYYESFRPILSELFPVAGSQSDDRSDEDKPLADKEQIADFYAKLQGAAEDMDCDILEDIITEMSNYRFPEEEKERVDSLKQAIDQYDYEKVIKYTE